MVRYLVAGKKRHVELPEAVIQTVRDGEMSNFAKHPIPLEARLEEDDYVLSAALLVTAKGVMTAIVF